jgi:pyruvate dehydrogenase E2 component (dihydrolipoamide acetyltransferase)
MAVEVIMPKVDMVMETGTFVEWLKSQGAPVTKGDPLFIITSDKASIEIESPASGLLAGVKASPGDVIPVTEVIAYILAPGEALPEPAAAKPQAILSAAAPERPALLNDGAAGSSPMPAAGLRATPLARSLAHELKVDLAQISGRGPRGRIHKADVLAYQQSRQERVAPVQRSPSFAAAAIPLPDARRKQVVPLAGARKVIAERMAFSAFTAPHIHLTLQVDMSEASAWRAKIGKLIEAKTGYRLSFTSIVARSVAFALTRHPFLNASLSDDQIILWEDVHLGVATSIDDFLIVPVIREAQIMNLTQVVTALGDLLDRARSKRLLPAEMSGSTFTISNLGMYGIESFTAIINPPEAGILAIGKIEERPVSTPGGLAFRPMMTLTLSADHRIIDGVAAARFLADCKDILENPYLLI